MPLYTAHEANQVIDEINRLRFSDYRDAEDYVNHIIALRNKVAINPHASKMITEHEIVMRALYGLDYNRYQNFIEAQYLQESATISNFRLHFMAIESARKAHLRSSGGRTKKSAYHTNAENVNKSEEVNISTSTRKFGKKKNAKKQNYKKGKCFNCGKMGHYAKECRSKKAKEKSANERHSDDAMAFTVEIVKSGSAKKHMPKHRKSEKSVRINNHGNFCKFSTNEIDEKKVSSKVHVKTKMASKPTCTKMHTSRTITSSARHPRTIPSGKLEYGMRTSTQRKRIFVEERFPFQRDRFRRFPKDIPQKHTNRPRAPRVVANMAKPSRGSKRDVCRPTVSNISKNLRSLPTQQRRSMAPRRCPCGGKLRLVRVQSPSSFYKSLSNEKKTVRRTIEPKIRRFGESYGRQTGRSRCHREKPPMDRLRATTTRVRRSRRSPATETKPMVLSTCVLNKKRGGACCEELQHNIDSSEKIELGCVGEHKEVPRGLEAIIDSGATCHLFNLEEEYFKEYEERTTSVQSAKKGSQFRCIGRGNVPAFLITEDDKKIKMQWKDVHHAPTINRNLLSVSKLIERGHEVEFFSDFATITSPGGEVFMATKVEGLYVIEFFPRLKPSEELALNVRERGEEKEEDGVKLLHYKLAHLPLNKMKKLVKNNQVKVEKNIQEELMATEELTCLGCVQAKAVLKSLPKKSSSRTNFPLELVHTDSCGPFTGQFSGEKFVTVFVDDFSRMMFLFKQRSLTGDGTLEALANFNAMAKNILGCGVKYLRSDRGTDYTSEVVRNSHNNPRARYHTTILFSHTSRTERCS